MTSMDSNFNFLYGRIRGALPLPSSTCVLPSLTRSPVINGWPQIGSDHVYKVTWRDVVVHYQRRYLSTGGSWVRIPLYPPRRDLGQVLHSQLRVALRRETLKQ